MKNQFTIGAGKTIFCNMAIEEYADRYNTWIPNFETIDGHKHLVEQVSNFMTSNDVSKCLT